MAWQIEGWNGADLIFERSIPGNMSESEVLEILRRLVSRHLSAEEVVASSLRRRAIKRVALLDRIGQRMTIQVGENPYYTAERKDACRLKAPKVKSDLPT